MLRYFDSVGIELDLPITVVERRDYAGTVAIELARRGSTESIDLGHRAAEAIWMVPAT
jgi:DtxR family Mn-dependent transcriptional regulator